MRSRHLGSSNRTDIATRSSAIDFSPVLERMIASLRGDPAQLRNTIYELARIKLQREVWNTDPPINILEMRRLMLALETAIERVETVASQQDEANGLIGDQVHALPSLDEMVQLSDAVSRDIRHEPALIIDRLPSEAAGRISKLVSSEVHVPTLTTGARGRRAGWAAAVPLLRGCLVAMFAVALCVLLDWQFGLFGKKSPLLRPPTTAEVAPAGNAIEAGESSAALPAAVPSAARQTAGLPLPSVYGVYAVSGGALYELEALPGRVPDQKVFMSTPVKTPSRAVVPDGRVVFIVYRRDIASNAPDRVAVRSIAKVMRAMTFSAAGQAATVPVDGHWSIRGTAIDFRVAPLSESAEMLVVRPEQADFAFPAGRYGLVLKGQAYDFTVDGPIVDPGQCLERIEAANGAFYSECKAP